MNEQLIKVNGVDICCQSFGNPGDPAVLLIMGAQSSMVWWEEEFCQRIADAGRFVIRYDNRDVGRSVTYKLGHPEYTFEDMVDDAVGILDAYGIEKAHIAGMSMGGMLTQMLALRHPDRVLTVTLLATSNFAPGLPPMEEKVMSFFSNLGTLNWANEHEVIDFIVARGRICAGTKYSYDEDRVRRLAAEEVQRSSNPESMNNHGMVTGGESYLTRTAEISVPVLVIHGSEDPVIPLEHGKALAGVIPGASLLMLQGIGHELHHNDWDTIIDAIVNHTSVSPA
ncbi:alpha/beta fold hydrolase [Paenibacillus sp. P96]|uniref:Alpha/beta fold hydrolase n=1 Tax=Paenibacillus zeirhizosphaerae TaxID=2987519 RepID=A0ABT9FWE4_9BACL|nr:alpha/beta hydrolase [Paenibacillus sp. P96]MDP4099049.1 alpha/beta fold hydrolase [Paenibacillus sp. P96]